MKDSDITADADIHSYQDGGHNSREDNEAFRQTFDETNARYLALCAQLEIEDATEKRHD
jgi:hypothetical protein